MQLAGDPLGPTVWAAADAMTWASSRSPRCGVRQVVDNFDEPASALVASLEGSALASDMSTDLKMATARKKRPTPAPTVRILPMCRRVAVSP